MDLEEYLAKHIAWSTETFGPGVRNESVVDHIREELEEVLATPDDVFEWVDIIILALDGAWRNGCTPVEIASALRIKQGINMARKWPDWRKADTSKSIKHTKEG